VILLEWHIWMGFFAGHHDLFMYRVTLGWVSIYVDRVPVSNNLRRLRDQMRELRRKLKQDDDSSVP
jgi:hypothetical protein